MFFARASLRDCALPLGEDGVDGFVIGEDVPFGDSIVADDGLPGGWSSP